MTAPAVVAVDSSALPATVARIRSAAAAEWAAADRSSPAARDYATAVADEGDVLVSLAQAAAAGAPAGEIAAIRVLLSSVSDRRDAAARRLGLTASGVFCDWCDRAATRVYDHDGGDAYCERDDREMGSERTGSERRAARIRARRLNGGPRPSGGGCGRR